MKLTVLVNNNTLHLYEKVGYHIVSKDKMGGLSMIFMKKVIIR